MLQKVQKFMTELNMVSPKDVILVGVSGGADSVGLLLMLYAIYKDEDVSLEVVHVEHGIRGEESLADAEFVQELCQRMGLQCHMISVDVPTYAKDMGLGIEEAARLLRYEAFGKVARERGAKVALAHHMEDNAETILFQLARGSALTGLCGMQPIRMDENGITYLRPFLVLHREEIENFLMSHGQGYCVDSTNKDLDYNRNYLRQMVLPALAKVNTQAISHINETAEGLSELKSFLDEEVDKNWRVCVDESEKGLCIDLEKVLCLHPVVQKEILYRGISKMSGSKKDISNVHVNTLRDLCDSQSGREVSLPYQLQAKKEYNKLWIFIKKDIEIETEKKESYDVSQEDLEECLKDGKEFCIKMHSSGESITCRVFEKSKKNNQFPQNSCTKWMDYDKIKRGFCIRTRQSGDYFISDVFGHHKSLNRYFIDEKIPSSQRDDMWLLAQNQKVIWLIGGRISEHVKITDDTKFIVELKYQGGNFYER